MIYIDPPYNTGNDFVYSDDFKDPLGIYLQKTGQLDESGFITTSNTKAIGRYHSNWLNMLYPRLLLARPLLNQKGVIFVSIDDNEVHNLRHLMDEVFGEENFVVQIPWQSRLSVQNDTDISSNHEYILCYARNRRQAHRRLKESNKDEWYKLSSFAIYPLPLNKDRFSNPDDDPRGPWKADPFDAPNIRPNLTYAIKNPVTGEEHWPPNGRHWRMEEEKFKELLSNGRIIFGLRGTSRPQLKVFYEDKKDFGEVRTSWFSGKEYGTTTTATKEIQDLFNGKALFDTPKPTSLLKELLKMATKDDDIILDFFAGSCSIAHAIFDSNREEKERKRFICIQLPEEVREGSLAWHEGYKKISDIGRERIKKISNKLKSSQHEEIEDLGFISFSLSKSNFKNYELIDTKDIQVLESIFENTEEPLIDNWDNESLLVEIMLMNGFPLESKILIQKECMPNEVIKIEAKNIKHHLYICLDNEFEPKSIENINLAIEDILVCFDNALDDDQKIILGDQCHLKII